VTSKLNACEYCVAHHTKPLEIEGLSRAAIDRLPEIEGNPELTEVDKLVVEYTVAVTNTAGRIRDRMFERLREHFSEAQIVELTLRIALCGFFNRFNDALMIDNELEHETHAAAE
jgi:AhpD family alkylhydroperoxidase